MTTWPLQKDCDQYYGNPRGSCIAEVNPDWERANIVRVKPPFKIYMDDELITKGCRVHRLVAPTLEKIFNEIWEAARQDQAIISKWGMSKYDGAFVYRSKRSGRSLSMHAYGCAIDFDAERNGQGDTTPNFQNVPHVVNIFERHGAVWGGRWSGRSCDGMHFQFARVS